MVTLPVPRDGRYLALFAPAPFPPGAGSLFQDVIAPFADTDALRPGKCRVFACLSCYRFSRR